MLIEKPDGRRYRILLYSGHWLVAQYTSKGKPPALCGIYKTMETAMRSIK